MKGANAMVDEESQDVASDPAGGAPVNRDRQRDPGVIDGEVAARVDGEAPAAAAADVPKAEAPPRFAPPERPAPGAGRAFAFGALGGLIVSALAAAGGYYAYAPKTDLAEADAGRLAALETQVQSGGEEAQRQGAAIAGLDKRLGALEAASTSEAAKIAAAVQSAQSAQGVATDLKSLRADVDAARGEIPGLAARVAKLEFRSRADRSRRAGNFGSRRTPRQGRGRARRAQERDARRRGEARGGRQPGRCRDRRRGAARQARRGGRRSQPNSQRCRASARRKRSSRR